MDSNEMIIVSTGLFSRAILQSGSALCPWAFNRTPLKVAFEVATSLGCPTDQGSNSLLVCLQGLDASVLSPLYQQPRVSILHPLLNLNLAY